MSNTEMLDWWKYMEKTRNKPSTNTLDIWMKAWAPDLQVNNWKKEKVGKWCIFVTTAEVDGVWKRIEKAVQKNRFGLAKCATVVNASRYKGMHVICIYTKDWEDMDDLKKTRSTLRRMGFREPLKYKRDMETIAGIYGTDKEFFLEM